jgi:hypothetical protein
MYVRNIASGAVRQTRYRPRKGDVQRRGLDGVSHAGFVVREVTDASDGSGFRSDVAVVRNGVVVLSRRMMYWRTHRRRRAVVVVTVVG